MEDRALTTNGPLRVGVVGLGSMGSRHARNAVDLGHEIAGGVDVDPETRDQFGRTFSAPTYERHDVLYERTDLDAVIIATPNAFHERVAVAAFERGLDVLVEKPLAHDLERAERTAHAARDSDAVGMVGFHNRFSPAAAAFTEYQAEGRFGDLTHVEANYVRRRGVPSHGSWFTDPDLAGGGALVDIGVHAIDLALYLLGFPRVDEVTGTTRSEFGQRAADGDPDDEGSDGTDTMVPFDVEDSASAFVRTADDRIVSLEVAWAASRPPTDRFVVRGTRGGATFDLGGDSLTLHSSAPTRTGHTRTSEATTAAEQSPHRAQLRTFLDAVENGEAPACNTVEQALAVQRVVDAIYRSDENDHALSVTPTPERGPVRRCPVWE